LSFLYPLFLLGALAIAIPIVLHLFRRRTDLVVEFPAVRLLEKAPVERQRRRRLRELILLALRVGALLLLALAFARPYFDRAAGAIPAPVTVVALDTSLSLSAPGQIVAAQQAARRAVESAPATHAVALVTFADSATISMPPTTDRGGLLQAIDAVTVTAGGTRYRTALARAAEVIGSRSGRIVVITDLQQVGWDAGDEGGVPDGIDVEIVGIDPPAGNVAVTAARRDGAAIVAAIHNFGSQPARVPVRLRVDDRDLSAQPVDIAPQAAAEIRLESPLPTRGTAIVTIDDRTGYQGDNARYLLLDPPGAVPIYIVTSHPPGSTNAGLYVERALTVADDSRAFNPLVIDGRDFSAMPGDRPLADAGALVILGTSTLERRGRDVIAAFIRDGGRVLVSLGPDTDLETLSDTLGIAVEVSDAEEGAARRTVTLAAVDGRHPIFRPFASPTGALGDVYVEQYRRLNDLEGRTVLARFAGAGIAMTEQAVGRGRLLLFASDLENRWNRFPLNPAFVPWAIETARYLAQGREKRQSYTLPNIPSGISPAPGVYDLPSAAAAAKSDDTKRQAVRVAVNVDVRESNPARTSVEEFVGAVTRLNPVAGERALVEARQQEDQQRLWQVGLVVMFLALVGEGIIGRQAA
jgi:Aerotolerance regulator N-terminal/von Willebrand factor type A domain